MLWALWARKQGGREGEDPRTALAVAVAASLVRRPEHIFQKRARKGLKEVLQKWSDGVKFSSGCSERQGERRRERARERASGRETVRQTGRQSEGRGGGTVPRKDQRR